MVKSKDWQHVLARTLRWRYLVLDEGEPLCSGTSWRMGLCMAELIAGRQSVCMLQRVAAGMQQGAGMPCWR